MSNLLLEVKDLQTSFFTRDGIVPAVDGVSFSIDRGEILGMVGESGCGKSITSLSIMRLVDKPGRIVSGSIQFDAVDLLQLSERDMRDIRSNRIAMIFQEPMSSLNPVLTIGRQITESILLHRQVKPKEARAIAVEALAQVGIAMPEKRMKDYPHQLSGGMRQRAMIAMALVCRPALLIADEPTTALDVTIQAQILSLLKNLNSHYAMAILMITHSLGIIADMAERVLVMYAGEVVEEAPKRELLKDPRHPYTQGLLAAIPRIHQPADELAVIRGVVPRPSEFPEGCRFHPRCDACRVICRKEKPPLRTLTEGHQMRCFIGTDAYAESESTL